ncbi:uncharacterized protein LOC129717672 [Wyeomyia smithii]|uniref:uncharacterized protein LOC129717672 n=1 Tax=Wyeomyia smithii TaxID=174621 RepID=UPI002467F104|nr:uncharacterized protein LOC129717672 [Wyeomyia smithii]XP_055523728.1 uncharacterized protein LOC129717672 [Wyeomyia smithii]
MSSKWLYPIRCCVSKCDTQANHYKGVKKRFFRFVSERPPQKNASEKSKRLYKQRFRLWSRLLRTGAKVDTKNIWICAKHFVKGYPASSLSCYDEDWIPSLKLNKNICMRDEITPELSSTVSNSVNVENQNELSSTAEPFCRLCLRKKFHLKPIFLDKPSSYIAELIEEISDIRLGFKSDCNSYICLDCHTKLHEIKTIRQKWQTNDSILRNGINTISYATPIPVVSIPVERLLENNQVIHSRDKFNNVNMKQKLLKTIVVKEETVEEILSDQILQSRIGSELTRASNISVNDMNNTSKRQYSSDIKETDAKDKSIQISSDNIKIVPKGQLSNDIEEREEKEKLIRSLMKKIRRKTFTAD